MSPKLDTSRLAEDPETKKKRYFSVEISRWFISNALYPWVMKNNENILTAVMQLLLFLFSRSI